MAPTRKLISATIPNASAPHCWMFRVKSARRKRAVPRSIFTKARLSSPKKARNWPTDCPYPILTAPMRSSTRRRTLPGCASFFSGTDSASSSSRTSPWGNPLRSTVMPRDRHTSLILAMKVTKALSHAPSSLLSKVTRVGGGSLASSRSRSLVDGSPRSSDQVPSTLITNESSSRSNRTTLSSAEAVCSAVSRASSGASEEPVVKSPDDSGIT